MPNLASQFVDLPLQALSAHVARSFASLIGFPPTSTQLLKLMFTPDFGMFIAPGCDGLRGALTMGYIALIVGYLRRVSLPRWIAYVAGAVLLGYLFNLLRLCTLVLYYRIAAGHPALEGVARQADYGIGACFILVAAVLFFWVSTKGEASSSRASIFRTPTPSAPPGERLPNRWKVAAFAVLTLLFAIPGAHATQNRLESIERLGTLNSQQLNDLMPKQLGEYKLNRAWQEKLGSTDAIECASYAAPGSDVAVLGIWLLPIRHSVHASWMVHGGTPELRANRSFATALGRAVSFDSAFYEDGVTDSLVADAVCTSSSCLPSQVDGGMHVSFRNPKNFTTRGMRAVPILFRVESLHTEQPKSEIQQALSAEAQRFLRNVDFAQISQTFQ